MKSRAGVFSSVLRGAPRGALPSLRFRAFGRLLASDLRYGFATAVPRFALFAFMAALSLFLSCVVLAVRFPQALGPSFTVGEALLCMWRGMLPYVPGQGEPFQFPMAWFALLVCALYVTVDYPFRDLGGMGAHMIVASRSRWSWWLAKCGWVIAMALVCWAVTFAMAGAFTLALGGEFELGVRPGVASTLSAGRNEATNAAASLVASGELEAAAAEDASIDIGPAMLALGASLAAVLLVQSAVALLVHPVVGMIAGVSVLFFSAYFRVWWLPGEYLMLARTDVLMRAGFHPWVGAVLALVVGVAAVLLGGLVFSRRDILGKGGDDQ